MKGLFIAVLLISVVNADLLLVGVRMPSLVHRLPSKWQRKLSKKSQDSFQELEAQVPQKSPGVWLEKPPLQDLVPAHNNNDENNGEHVKPELLRPLQPAPSSQVMWRSSGRVPTLMRHDDSGYEYAMCFSFDQIPSEQDFQARLLLIWKGSSTHKFTISYDSHSFFPLDSRDATPKPLTALGVILHNEKGASRHGFSPNLIKNGRFMVFLRTQEQLRSVTLQMGSKAFRGIAHTRMAVCPKLPHSPTTGGSSAGNHSRPSFLRFFLAFLRHERFIVMGAAALIVFVFIVLILKAARRARAARLARLATHDHDDEEPQQQPAADNQYPGFVNPPAQANAPAPRVVYVPVYYPEGQQAPQQPQFNGLAPPPAYTQAPTYPQL